MRWEIQEKKFRHLKKRTKSVSDPLPSVRWLGNICNYLTWFITLLSSFWNNMVQEAKVQSEITCKCKKTARPGKANQDDTNKIQRGMLTVLQSQNEACLKGYGQSTAAPYPYKVHSASAGIMLPRASCFMTETLQFKCWMTSRCNQTKG